MKGEMDMSFLGRVKIQGWKVSNDLEKEVGVWDEVSLVS